MLFKGLLTLFCLLFLAGCGRTDLAPVSDLSAWNFSRLQKTHRVQAGETLYSIAFHYDSDYRALAKINHINPPYSLSIGQVIRLHIGSAPPRTKRYSRGFRAPVPLVQPTPICSPKNLAPSSSGWYWPTHGQVVASFFPTQGKKGIDIASKKGEKVYAAGGGVVAYSGSGLAGYGNLIIIKHNHEFLTAYGNNGRNLVREGQQVRAGQVIAEVGMVEHRYWGLHFEIRKAGKPVNPLIYLRKS